MANFTASLAAQPGVLLLSIRERIFQVLTALLRQPGRGAPQGLLVTRERLRPIEKEMLPAILLYADDDDPKPLAGQMYKAPLVERQLSLVVECRANSDNGPPDLALDPLLVWATQTIVENEQFGGLANGVEEHRTTWISREGEIAVAAAALHFTVKYRTARADPTKKDPNS
jgi:hypothetical protein